MDFLDWNCSGFIQLYWLWRSALFFGEKYMIEHLTKKVVDSFIYNSNKFVGWTTLNYM